jgi:hypothetical protein
VGKNGLIFPQESLGSVTLNIERPFLEIGLRSVFGNETTGGLDSDDKTTENAGMEVRGRVHNGVVVLEGELRLPEGSEVIVSSDAAPETKPVGEQRIEFPLVRSRRPGSLQLTGQRVAEFLEEDDVPA